MWHKILVLVLTWLAEVELFNMMGLRMEPSFLQKSQSAWCYNLAVFVCSCLFCLQSCLLPSNNIQHFAWIWHNFTAQQWQNMTENRKIWKNTNYEIVTIIVTISDYYIVTIESIWAGLGTKPKSRVLSQRHLRGVRWILTWPTAGLWRRWGCLVQIFPGSQPSSSISSVSTLIMS